MPYASASAERTITVQTVQNVVVSLTVDNDKPTAQQTITFTGRVTLDTTTPGANRSVNLYIVHPNYTAIRLTSGTTDSSGTFTYRWTVPWKVSSGTTTYYVPCTTWRAELCDSASGVCSPSVNIAVAYPTALSISTDKDTYTAGDKISVVAKLVYANDVSSQNPLPGATITFQLIDVSTGSTVATASATTDANGVASTTFTAPSKAGTYSIKATFGGMGYATPATVFRALSVPSTRTLLAAAAAVAPAVSTPPPPPMTVT
jgi:adhesin/invasin